MSFCHFKRNLSLYGLTGNKSPIALDTDKRFSIKDQKKALLDDELTTFSYAFECKENGSLNMLKAAKHARDLGLPKDEIIELLYRINAYWVYPLDESRLQSTLISQIDRW